MVFVFSGFVLFDDTAIAILDIVRGEQSQLYGTTRSTEMVLLRCVIVT